MSRCHCCFDNPAQYNDHMKSIHGIDTNLKRQAPPAPSAPQQAPSNPGFSSDLIVPLLQAIKGSNQKWIALEQLKHKPGRREVTEAWDDLLVSLTSTGSYNPMAELQDKANHKTILYRLKEMIHSNDLDDFRSSYRRSSEKTLDISHQICMDSVKKALFSIVDKNSGETAIKTVLDLQIQGGRPISK